MRHDRIVCSAVHLDGIFKRIERIADASVANRVNVRLESQSNTFADCFDEFFARPVRDAVRRRTIAVRLEYRCGATFKNAVGKELDRVRCQ